MALSPARNTGFLVLQVNNNRIEMTIDFEQGYSAVRKKENRIYSDSEVSRLPEILSSHDYSKEWKVRKRSAKRLIKYLKRKNRPLTILEIGCGNGWLSFQMSAIKYSEVIGVDINLEEVMQAKRVFKKDNLNFVHGEFDQAMFEDLKFDCIVFAASIQYFRSLKEIINDCLNLLAKEGEIHILDTHFYATKEREHAVARTISYYSSMGFPGMAENYHHHTYNDLKTFRYKIVSPPLEIISSLIRRERNFHWIIIKG
jgi:ubiquinone/menaquinone biosynthesis C-methylase UbiE